MLLVLLGIVLFILDAFLVMRLMYVKLGKFKRLFHDTFKCHVMDDKGPLYYEGNCVYLKCKYCDKKIKLGVYM